MIAHIAKDMNPTMMKYKLQNALLAVVFIWIAILMGALVVTLFQAVQDA